jgi:hypothetical protein
MHAKARVRSDGETNTVERTIVGQIQGDGARGIRRGYCHSNLFGVSKTLRYTDWSLYQNMGIVCVNTLGLGKICYVFGSIGVIIVIFRMERNIFRGPTSIYSMPRQKHPNLFRRSLGVLRALQPKPK